MTVLADAEIGAELSIVRRWRVLHNLRSHDVATIRVQSVTEITQREVHYTDQEGEAHALAAQSVILATGALPNLDIAKQLSGAHRTHMIGDGAQVDYIEGALKSATTIALSI